MKSRFAGALALALSTFALADQAAANCGHGPFSGLYAGGGIGVAQADNEQTSPGDPKLSNDDTSFTVGGWLGYNIQCGQTVFGIEGDISYLGLETKGTWDSPFGPVHLKDEIDWFSSIRGRAGILLSPDTLVYVTGGVAFADVAHKLSTPGLPFSQTDSGWEAGWVIGGGIEFLRHGNWMFRAEALLVDLGSQSHRYVATTVCGFVCEDEAKWDDRFFVARLGASYKFGAPEESHRPLK